MEGASLCNNHYSLHQQLVRPVHSGLVSDTPTLILQQHGTILIGWSADKGGASGLGSTEEIGDHLDHDHSSDDVNMARVTRADVPHS